jgi:hypothetical protein
LNEQAFLARKTQFEAKTESSKNLEYVWATQEEGVPKPQGKFGREII